MSLVNNGDLVDAMWDVFTTGKTNDLVRRLRAGEDVSVTNVSEAAPAAPEQGKRYFTVAFTCATTGRRHHRHVEAIDGTHAGNRILWQHPSVGSAKVVREIDRNEFERLTLKPTGHESEITEGSTP